VQTALDARQFPIPGDVPSISAELSGLCGHGAFPPSLGAAERLGLKRQPSRRAMRVFLIESDFYQISENIGTINQALICSRLLLRDDKVSRV